ncbi:RNA-binding S4 domain-containing protein [Pleionea litopenaei]|uniref:Heat shock protein 15 n=1 Tax=Pleionea litopenaei TaxID=3070815 RepID=A0AA51RQR4_9GAMM|nr:S4 domain-containing protein [Pleionea sp. HL-JVS1]WMS85805.1 S4 domain-containing protein [Pleionea sp. HL-JVS1]
MSDEKKVRLDKWLWAARLYKTRSIAKEAIDGGKVHYDNHRVKPGRIVQVGAIIKLRIGPDERTIEVLDIAERRGPASVAQTLYQETPESIEQRQQAQSLRKAAGITHEGKPDKKQRRQIHRFKRINASE